jgi:two-component system LytT family response regulator
MINVVIIDDELPALQELQYLLTPFEAVRIVGAFTEAHQLLQEIGSLKPDVLFLDIEMRDLNGLVLAEMIADEIPQLKIVFVTAYNEYAVSAFETNAIDYLLKPVSQARLAKTIDRILKQAEEQELILEQEAQSRGFVHVRCFGRFQVVSDIVPTNGIVKWRTAKSEELFAFFIHHHGQALHKDFIMEHIWPNLGNDNALTMLHTTIYQVRKVIRTLHPDAELRFSQECYLLFIPDLDCDLFVFQLLAEEAIALSGDQMLKKVKRAMELYKGDYLEGNDYAWSMHQSRYIAEQYTSLLVFSTESLMGRNQDEEAIPFLKELINRNPLHESYYLQLFSIYARLRDDFSLTVLYEQLSRVLQQELGELPHPDTIAYYKNLR